jgi:hypothetical protein
VCRDPRWQVAGGSIVCSARTSHGTVPARHRDQRPTVMTEKQLLESIRDICRWSHLPIYHTYSSVRSEPGFPDLVVITRTGVLFRELKTDRGRLTTAQQMWLDELTRVGADAGVWRPIDWPHKILHELKVRQWVPAS